MNRTAGDLLRDRLAIQLKANADTYRDENDHAFFHYIWFNKQGTNKEMRSAWSNEIDQIASAHKLVECLGDIPILQAI